MISVKDPFSYHWLYMIENLNFEIKTRNQIDMKTRCTNQRVTALQWSQTDSIQGTNLNLLASLTDWYQIQKVCGRLGTGHLNTVI